jgi:hypothetical protein
MWTRDDAAEQLMKEIGITFEYRIGVAVKDINIKDSKAMNARCGDEADLLKIGEYVYAMRHGTKFPAIVLTMKFLVAAGIHRVLSVEELGLAKIDAYVILAATPQQMDEFVRRDNTRHGKPLDDQQKLISCVEYHLKYAGTPGAKSIKDLNDVYFGGNEKTYNMICVAVRAKKVEEKLLSKGVPATGLSNSTLAMLHPIADNSNVLRSAGALAAEYQFTTSQAEDLVKILQGKSTEQERLKAIQSERATLEVKVTGKGTIQPETSMRRELGRLLKFLTAGNNGKPFPPIDVLIKDEAERKELKAMINDIANGLKNLKAKS